MEMGGGGGTGYKRGGGRRAKIAYCNHLLCETTFQSSLLTTDQNIVFPVPFTIPVVQKNW